VRGYRQGDNPARWKGHLSEVLPAPGKVAKPIHHAALAYADMPEFMAELRKREGVGARALEFTILTAARTGEVIGAQWSEINFAERLWTIPVDRMKGGREHRVPLSDRAVELLRALPTEDHNGFVFIGPNPGTGISKMAMPPVLKRMGHNDITIHGFRSCFMDWAHEQSTFPKVVIDKALAHAIGDKAEAAYRRGDLLIKRRQLAEAWSRFCMSPAPAGAVLPMRRPA
jgi:integrase